MTRRGWFLLLSLGALLAVAALYTPHRRSLVPAHRVAARAPQEVAPTGAVLRLAQPSSAQGHLVMSDAASVPAPDDADDRDDTRLSQPIASPVFSRLPPSDQRWVLVQARSRTHGPDDPRLQGVVHELSEVRLFTVSEREEPLAPLDPSR